LPWIPIPLMDDLKEISSKNVLISTWLKMVKISHPIFHVNNGMTTRKIPKNK
jgi:hypothetical protein